MRKETLHKYINMGQKSDLEILIFKFSMDTTVELSVGTSIDRLFVDSCQDSLNLDRCYLSRVVESHSSFNEQFFFTCFLDRFAWL